MTRKKAGGAASDMLASSDSFNYVTVELLNGSGEWTEQPGEVHCQRPNRVETNCIQNSEVAFMLSLALALLTLPLLPTHRSLVLRH